MFGRNLRTSARCPASSAIPLTVAEVIRETLASSKMPRSRCVISTGDPWRRLTSAASCSLKRASSSPPGVRTCVGRPSAVLRTGAKRSSCGSLVAVSQGNPPRSPIRRSARRLSPSRPCQPSSAVSRASPPIDFTGYLKSASSSPILTAMCDLVRPARFSHESCGRCCHRRPVCSIRSLGRRSTPEALQCSGNCLRLGCGNPKKGQSRPLGRATPLPPVAERGDADADHESDPIESCATHQTLRTSGPCSGRRNRVSCNARYTSSVNDAHSGYPPPSSAPASSRSAAGRSSTSPGSWYSASGAMSAPFGHATVPPSRKNRRKYAGLLRGSKTGPLSQALKSTTLIKPSLKDSRIR